MPSSAAHRASPARRILRAVALLLVVGTLGFWAAKGAHIGWSQNRVPIAQRDEITGIDYVTYEDRFVPGVDTVAAGLGLAALVFGTSFFFRPKSSPST
jgi:hypothetical protein